MGQKKSELIGISIEIIFTLFYLALLFFLIYIIMG